MLKPLSICSDVTLCLSHIYLYVLQIYMVYIYIYIYGASELKGSTSGTAENYCNSSETLPNSRRVQDLDRGEP